MTKTQMKELGIGDLVRHKDYQDPRLFVVTGNYGGHVTAVDSVDITNPEEWDVIAKASYPLGSKK